MSLAVSGVQIPNWGSDSVKVADGRSAFILLSQSLNSDYSHSLNISLPALIKELNEKLIVGKGYDLLKRTFDDKQFDVVISQNNLALIIADYVVNRLEPTPEPGSSFRLDSIKHFLAHKINKDLDVTGGVCVGSFSSLKKFYKKFNDKKVLSLADKAKKHISNGTAKLSVLKEGYQDLVDKLIAFQKILIPDFKILMHDIHLDKLKQEISGHPTLPLGDKSLLISQLEQAFSPGQKPIGAWLPYALLIRTIVGNKTASFSPVFQKMVQALEAGQKYAEDLLKIEPILEQTKRIEASIKQLSPTEKIAPVPQLPNNFDIPAAITAPFVLPPAPPASIPPKAVAQPHVPPSSSVPSQPLIPQPAVKPVQLSIPAPPTTPLFQRRITQRKGCSKCIFTFLACIRSIWKRLFKC